MGLLFLVLQMIFYRSALIPRKLPSPPKEFLVTRLQYSNQNVNKDLGTCTKTFCNKLQKLKIFAQEEHISASSLINSGCSVGVSFQSVSYDHVTCEFQSESTLYSLPECQETPCSKQALSVRLRTKWLWVRILLPSLKLLFLVLQVKKALRYSSFTVNFLQLSRKAFVQNKFIENETNSNQTYPMGMVILFATPIAETNIRQATKLPGKNCCDKAN